MAGNQSSAALAPPRDRSSGETSPIVLWIDDEVAPDDPSVRVLTSEGFRVDCARCAAMGLAMAKCGLYHAIILDLHLPDTPGLALLERLRMSGIATPVLVLTGYGDLESAVAALRLGVADFQQKPLIAEELVAAVRGVVAHARLASGVVSGHSDRARLERRESHAARRLLALLHEIAKTADEDDANQKRLVAALMLTAETRTCDVTTFLACAEALRHVLGVHTATPVRARVAQVQRLIRHAETEPPIEHRTVRAALERIAACVGAGVRPSEHEIAGELGVDPAHLGRLIRTQTRRGFTLWRSAFTVQVAVRELVNDDAQIAQIAFGVGYEHPSQLDREFHRLFPVSPREYRRLRRTLLRHTS